MILVFVSFRQIRDYQRYMELEQFSRMFTQEIEMPIFFSLQFLQRMVDEHNNPSNCIITYIYVLCVSVCLCAWNPKWLYDVSKLCAALM